MPRDGDWREEAFCKDMVVHDFYPEDRNPSHTAAYKSEVEALRAICAQCPFQKECLESALEVEVTIEHGIFAGTTPAQRKKLILDANEEDE